jgi:hypothetical protein
MGQAGWEPLHAHTGNDFSHQHQHPHHAAGALLGYVVVCALFLAGVLLILHASGQAL